jgi:hypothetical protein
MKTQLDFQPVFAQLRGILEKHSTKFEASPDKAGHYGQQVCVNTRTDPFMTP